MNQLQPEAAAPDDRFATAIGHNATVFRIRKVASGALETIAYVCAFHVPIRISWGPDKTPCMLCVVAKTVEGSQVSSHGCTMVSELEKSVVFHAGNLKN